MNPTEQFSALATEAGMSEYNLADVLRIQYKTLLRIFGGKMTPSPGLIGDLVQVLEDIAFWRAYFTANPESDEYYEAMRDYRIKKIALDSIEKAD